MQKQSWWSSFNPPERYDPNSSSIKEDVKYSLAVWGVLVLVVGSITWLVVSVL